MPSRVYLDHNATTRPDPAVVAEMLPCLESGFGNPSSPHAFGQEARRHLDTARQRVASLIGAEPEEIVFTSGGTEADNQAVRGLAGAGRRIVVSGIEHQAVLAPCRDLAGQGLETVLVAADRQGRVPPEAVAAVLDDNTSLVSVMLVNNDTGVIQPIAEIAALARSRGIPMHTDAVQAAGKIAVNVAELGVDFLSLSSHKLHGPKGVGALYVRRGCRLPALLSGGSQEERRRAGTENLPGIAGFGKACELAGKRIHEESPQIAACRDELQLGLLELCPEAIVNGTGAPRTANTLLISFPGIDARSLALNLDLAGIAVSTGSACSSQRREPSHVLLAMGRTPAEAAEAIRFSLGRETSREEIHRTLETVRRLLPSLRRPGHPEAR